MLKTHELEPHLYAELVKMILEKSTRKKEVIIKNYSWRNRRLLGFKLIMSTFKFQNISIMCCFIVFRLHCWMLIAVTPQKEVFEDAGVSCILTIRQCNIFLKCETQTQIKLETINYKYVHCTRMRWKTWATYFLSSEALFGGRHSSASSKALLKFRWNNRGFFSFVLQNSTGKFYMLKIEYGLWIYLLCFFCLISTDCNFHRVKFQSCLKKELNNFNSWHILIIEFKFRNFTKRMSIGTLNTTKKQCTTLHRTNYTS